MNRTATIRCAAAQIIIDMYRESVAHRSPDEALIDLLADLVHWTDGNGLDFQTALDHAQFHHDAEVQP